MPPALGLEYNESNSNLGKRPHKLFKTVYIDQSMNQILILEKDLTNSLKLCTLINPELYLQKTVYIDKSGALFTCLQP